MFHTLNSGQGMILRLVAIVFATNIVWMWTQDLLNNVMKSKMQCCLQAGNIATAEMYRTFNMGVGMVVIVPALDVEKALAIDGAAFVLGSVVKGDEVKIV